jgi:hypothetical protein
VDIAHGVLVPIAVVRQTHAVRQQGEPRSGESIPPITTTHKKRPLFGGFFCGRYVRNAADGAFAEPKLSNRL